MGSGNGPGVLKATTRLFGPTHELTLNANMSMARLLVWQGLREETESLEAQVKEVKGVAPDDLDHWVDRLENLVSAPGLGGSEEACRSTLEPRLEWQGRVYSDTGRIHAIMQAHATDGQATELWKDSLAPMDETRAVLSNESNLSFSYAALDRAALEIRLLIIYSGTIDEQIQSKLM